MLRTLATTEASVLAIVFSVTVVSLQLVVTRYSSRLTSLFIKEPLYRITFTLFICAVAFDLLALYLLPASMNRTTNAAVGVAFALAGAAAITLYRFIQLVIQRSSPDELITALVERELRPAKYLPERPDDLRTATVHPLRPLYSTVSRATELAEYRTAKKGVEALQTVLNNTFAYLRANHDMDEAHEFAEAVSEEIFTEYFPEIIEQVFSHEQHGLISDTTDAVEQITLNVLHLGFTDVAEHATEGLSDVFNDVPHTWEGNRLRKPVSETLVRLTEVTASAADYSTFLTVFHNLQNPYAVLLRRRPEKDVTRTLVSDYYGRHSISIFKELVDRYGPQVQQLEVNWISTTDGRKSTLQPEAKPLRHFWHQRTAFTQEIFHYRASQEEYPFVEEHIDAGWQQFIERAATAGLDGLATLFCISTIQVAYRVDQFGEGRPGLWTNHLANLRIDHNQEIVDNAFALLKEGVQPDGSRIQVQSIPYDPSQPDQGFFQRFFSNSDTDEETFENWLEEFQQEVIDRTKYIKE